MRKYRRKKNAAKGCTRTCAWTHLLCRTSPRQQDMHSHAGRDTAVECQTYRASPSKIYQETAIQASDGRPPGRKNATFSMDSPKGVTDGALNCRLPKYLLGAMFVGNRRPSVACHAIAHSLLRGILRLHG